MNTQLLASAVITILVLGCKIIQAVQELSKIRTIKMAEIEKLEKLESIENEKRRTARAVQQEAEDKKRKAELEKITAEIKLKLAEQIASMSEEQLAAYNRTLQQPKKEYVPMPYPVPYVSNYGYHDLRAALQSQQCIGQGMVWTHT